MQLYFIYIGGIIANVGFVLQIAQCDIELVSKSSSTTVEGLFEPDCSRKTKTLCIAMFYAVLYLYYDERRVIR